MEENYEIKKVLVRKDGIKYLIIPKLSNLNVGDYVAITKVNMEETDGRKRKERNN